MNLDGHFNHEIINGVDTGYWTYGNPKGELVVLVHGFRGDHHGLEDIARNLVTEHSEARVVIPDLPGFGNSLSQEKNTHSLKFFGEWLSDFVATQQQSSNEPFVLVAHSFGTLVAAQAIDFGLLPTRAVLINPISSPALQGPQAVMTQLAIAYYKVAELLPEKAARALLANRFIVRMMSEFMAKSRDREMRAFIHDQHHQFFSTYQNSVTLLQTFTASVSNTVVDFSQSFVFPTLIIAGEKDDISPLAAQLSLNRLLSQSDIKILSGVGHLVHYEVPKEAAQLINEFLNVERMGVRT